MVASFFVCPVLSECLRSELSGCRNDPLKKAVGQENLFVRRAFERVVQSFTELHRNWSTESVSRRYYQSLCL